MTMTLNYCVPPLLHTYIKKVMVNNYYLYQLITTKRVTTSNSIYLIQAPTIICTSWHQSQQHAPVQPIYQQTIHPPPHGRRPGLNKVRQRG